MYELLDLFSELKDIHYLTARRGARDNALQGRRPAAPPPIKILKMSELLFQGAQIRDSGIPRSLFSNINRHRGVTKSDGFV